MTEIMSVAEAVASRRSVRAFLDKEVPHDAVRRVLDRARFAPSGCNFQPWEATVLTGAPLAELRDRMLAAAPQEPMEYSYSEPNKSPVHLARLQDVGARMYGAMGVGRSDKDARAEFLKANIRGFGAPVLLVCYMERLMAAPQWSDVGMWLQTIMLLLREEGLDSCPQESLSHFAKLIKDFVGVSDESHILFCGLAIGYRDETAPVNTFDRPRIPLEEQVRFLGF